ncbi:hypothetical protein HNR02_005299 [Amycolatopsis endophytica]|uniref:Uncharacterized protein n=1 Tax=Amycolatopsis endophytica TaxID=860233 RepID=A0A853BB01_9PSEU|nr:hypothetical protein [Amycolatopsis endophytica]
MAGGAGPVVVGAGCEPDPVHRGLGPERAG